MVRARFGGTLGAVTRRALALLLVLAACEGRAPPAASSAAPASAAAAGGPPVVAPAVLSAAIAAGVRPRGSNEAGFEVDAFLAALVVEELAAGGGAVRVEPAIEGGAQVGYRLLEVAEGSVYARVGLRAGDVVQAINDVPLESPGRAVGVLGALGRGAAVTVLREGVSFTLDLRISGGLAWSELLRARGGPALAADVPPDRVEAPDPLDLLDAATPPPGSASPKASGAGASGAGKPARPAPGRPAASTGDKPTSAVVQCASASSCSVDRRTFDAMVANPSRLLQQVDVAPTTGGYKLTRVAAGSAVNQLGFRAGDKLISVNGSRLDDDMEALGLYMGLGSTSTYRVVYERGGVRSTKTISLRG